MPGPYVCGECGSMIQKKQDDDGKMRGVYHGIGGRDGKNVWKDPRVVSICLLCGDRKQLKTNCVSRTLLKAPATQPQSKPQGVDRVAAQLKGGLKNMRDWLPK